MRRHIHGWHTRFSVDALRWRFTSTARRLSLAAIAISCGGGGADKAPTAPPVPTLVLTTLTVSLSATTLQVGQTATASASGADQNGGAIATGTVTWQSVPGTVATISSSGEITALAAGQATITATSQGRSASGVLTVLPRINRVMLSAAALSLDAIGATGVLVATPQDASGAAVTDVTVQWTTSAASVASVSSTGVVTAVGNGTATIVASVFGTSATASVTVSQVATRLLFVDGDLTVVAGQPIASPLRVRMVDRLGAACMGAGAVTATALNGAISGASTVAAARGEARFDDLRFPNAGTTRVRLSANGNIAPIDTSVVVLERPIGAVRATFSYPSHYYFSGPGGIVRADPLIEAVDAAGKPLNVSGLVRAIVLGGTGEIVGGDTATMLAGSARFAALRIFAPTNRGVMLGFYSTVLSLGTADVFGSYQTPTIALRRAAAADSVVPRGALFGLDIVLELREPGGSQILPVGMVRANVAFDSSKVALEADSVATSTGTMTRSPVGPAAASYTFTFVHATGLPAGATLLRLMFRAKTSGSARVDLLPSQFASPLGVPYYVYYWPLSVYVRIP